MSMHMTNNLYFINISFLCLDLRPPVITVAATGNTEVTLPENRVQIFTSTWPEPRYRGEFTYRWEKLFGPSAGTIDGKNNKDIQLAGVGVMSPSHHCLTACHG